MDYVFLIIFIPVNVIAGVFITARLKWYNKDSSR
jgi:hypothetical protein